MQLQALISTLLVIVTLVAGGYYAYQEGYLDPVIEKIG